ncbi:hypothetical protein IL306_002343 [Fusarium sp. DS 682]|nr:hypothetical protein IL306_002343 [Fusarium sp. DS 682]
MGLISCDDSFGPYASGCRGGFDLTLLFEETILVIPITVLLLLTAPCRIVYLVRKNAVKVENSYWIYCKIPSAAATRASLPTAALSFVASISLLGLSYVEHVYSYRPSTILNLFLLFSILFDATRTRTLWLQGYNQLAAIIALVVTVLKIVMLAVEATEKRGFLRLQYRTLPPEVTSGILTRWFFSWQLSLFRAGYSKKLEIGTLFPLEKHFKSLYLQNLLQTAWTKGLSSYV